jgi:hypothetical protein
VLYLYQVTKHVCNRKSGEILPSQTSRASPIGLLKFKVCIRKASNFVQKLFKIMQYFVLSQHAFRCKKVQIFFSY